MMLVVQHSVSFLVVRHTLTLTVQWYFRGSFTLKALRRQLKMITRNLPLLYISKSAPSVRLSSS